MEILLCSFIITISTIILRGLIYKDRSAIKFTVGWMLLISIASISAISTFFGFQELLNLPKSNEYLTEYVTILTVLSLLSAGIIAGNFAFSYQDASSDESILTNLISSIFITLFYILFSSVSYYLGKSIDTTGISEITYFLPSIMTLLLVVNILYNYWDYREVEE